MRKNNIFWQILIPFEKPVYEPVYSLVEISNENSFKQFVANSLLPNCNEGYYKEEGFYGKYLHWGCVNKWG